MKKACILVALFGCSLLQASAQSLGIAPEIGLNFTDLYTRYNGIYSSNNIRVGVKLGGVLDVGITRSFSIQPGLFYSMKGATQDFTTYSTVGNTVQSQETKYNYRIDYLEFPVNFQYKFSHSPMGHYFIGAGPYWGLALGGRATMETGTTVVNYNNGFVTSRDRGSSYYLNIGNNPAVDDVRRFDMGLNFNAGYQFRHGLLLRANYGLGLVNILPGGDANNYMRNWGLGLSVAYLFHL